MSEKNQVTIPVLGRIRSEFQCLEGKGHNSNVWKGIQNFNIWKEKGTTPVFGGKRSELNCLEG